MNSSLAKNQIDAMCIGSTQKALTIDTLKKFEITLPGLETQKKIAAILGALDDKIGLNNKINKNLEEQAQALFKEYFLDNPNPNWKQVPIDSVFDITIGKTPPRKEFEWFSENSKDVRWVSISDMGKCGTYISDTSEYLTKEAIQKFNIQVVPENTVLLSFKLTVGRIAITDCEMATNEAIAHFKTSNEMLREYLYCYLKNYKFETLGSTSSIATAVNSKIIKAMQFIIPDEDSLSKFHAVARTLFATIRTNEKGNQTLAQLRDTLLPKLMTGKLNCV